MPDKQEIPIGVIQTNRRPDNVPNMPQSLQLRDAECTNARTCLR